MIKIMVKIYSILVSLIIIIASSYLLIWYLNQSIIPQKLKSFLIQNFEKQTNYTLDIKKLKFSLTKGFELTDTKIADKQSPQEVIFSADRVYFKAIPIPSFKGIKLFVPFVDVLSAELSVKRNESGIWNMAFSKPANGKNLNLYTARISFSNAKISFADKYNNSNFTRIFDGVNGRIGLSIPRSLSFSLSGDIINDDLPKTLFSISGNYHMQNKNLSMNIDAKNLFLADYLAAYMPSDNFKLTDGALNVKGTIAAINLKKIRLNGKVDLHNGEIIAGSDPNKKGSDPIFLKGSGDIDGSASFEIGNADTVSYDINYNISNVMAYLNNPYLDKVRIAKSSGTLQTKLWDIKTFDGSIYEGPVMLSGTVSDPFKNPKVKIKITSEFDIVNLKNAGEFGLLGGLTKIDGALASRAEGGYRINGISKIMSLNLKSDNLSVSGDFDIRGQCDFGAGGRNVDNYKGDIIFNKATIGLSKELPFIENAEGEILFQTKSAVIKDLTGYAAASKVSVSGKLDYTKEPADISLGITANKLDINKFIESLPDAIKPKLADIKLEGIMDLNIDIKNNPQQPEAFVYKGSVKISNAGAAVSWLKDNINDINAEMYFEKNQLTWDKLSFSYKNNLYVSSGLVSDFGNPSINATLSSKDLKAKGVIKINDELLTVQGLDVDYKNFSVFGLNGYVKNFSAVGEISPPASPKRERDEQSGGKQPSLGCQFKADNIKIDKFNLGSLYLELIKENKLVSIPVLTLNPYSGIINITSRLNLGAEKRPYLININAKNIDLQKLIADTKPSPKTSKAESRTIPQSGIGARIKGLLSSTATLNGYLDEQNSLKGNGWVQVQGGYLGDFPVVYDLLDIILGIPAEHLILTDAFGNFSVAGKRIYTSDLKMLSQKAALLWEGSLGFDGSLDFNITGRFAEDIIKMTDGFGKLASAVLKEAGGYIAEVKLTGTIDKPKYSVIPFAVEKVIKEKVVDKITDALGKIFE